MRRRLAELLALVGVLIMLVAGQAFAGVNPNCSLDAGYEPLYAGPLENASAQEGFIKLVFGIVQGGMGPFVYRMAPPDQL